MTTCAGSPSRLPISRSQPSRSMVGVTVFKYIAMCPEVRFIEPQFTPALTDSHTQSGPAATRALSSSGRASRLAACVTTSFSAGISRSSKTSARSLRGAIGTGLQVIRYVNRASVGPKMVGLMPGQRGLSYRIGADTDVRGQFLRDGRLNGDIDRNFRAVRDRW